MNNERFNELAALDALDALEGADLAEFGALFAANPSLQPTVARMRDTVALIALSQSPAQPPSPDLKAKVLAKIKSCSRKPSRPVVNPFYFIGVNEGEWQTLPVAGVRVKNLAEDKRRGVSMKLYELAPGVRFPGHHHSGPEECFVVSGDFHVEGRVLHAGDFHHAEEHSDHDQSYTEGGCTLLIVATTADYE